MAQPAVFVQFQSADQANPVAMALSLIAKAAGGRIVEQMVDDQEKEADIAVVNTVEAALRVVKETERTVVYLCYYDFRNSPGFCASAKEALAFAVRFPERVKASAFFCASQGEDYVFTLMRAIGEMAKEGRE